MDIFTEKRFHPGQDNLLKEHYKDFYDTVFVALSPFFKLNNNGLTNPAFQKSHTITFAEAKEAIDDLKNIPEPNATIYSYQNDNYPTDREIIENAISVSWDEVKHGCNFADYSEINKALKTSIGGYKQIFRRDDLVKRLLDFTEANQIYIPTEGHFEVLSKVAMLKAFRLLDKKTIVVENEYQDKKIELAIKEISEEQFVEAITFTDYYIYDTDKQLLFAVDWDDFFFLICSSKDRLTKINSSLNFEGFYCDDKTESTWELTKEELKLGLEGEIKQKQDGGPAKKPWWKIW